MSSRQQKKIRGSKGFRIGGIDKDELEEVRKRNIKFKLLNKKVLFKLSDLKFKYDFERKKLMTQARKKYINLRYLKSIILNLMVTEKGVKNKTEKLSKKYIENLKKELKKDMYGNIVEIPNNLPEIISFLKKKHKSSEITLNQFAEKIEKFDSIYKPKIKDLENKLKNVD